MYIERNVPHMYTESANIFNLNNKDEEDRFTNYWISIRDENDLSNNVVGLIGLQFDMKDY